MADGTPPEEYGTLYVVGIGPGLPHAMTQRATDVIESADCVIASNLYQEFLREDGTLPTADGEDESEATDAGEEDDEAAALDRPVAEFAASPVSSGNEEDARG